jgi:hypothetical protein
MADEKVGFATHLTHQFTLVDAQVQSGLYVVKRTSQYLKKVVTAQGECAIALDKATKNEATKVPSLKADGMASHVTAVCSLQDVFNGVINKYREFGAKVTSDVIAPLQEFLKVGEKKRKDVLAKEAKATKNIRAQYDKLRNARKNAMTTWEQVQKTQKELSQAGDSTPKGQKIVPVLKKLVEKAKKDFQIFEKTTDETFSMAQDYFNNTLPELLKQMEEIEKERLQLLKAQLALFAKLYNIWDSPTSPGNSYGETVAGLDAKSDLHKCIVAKVSEYGMPQGPPELPPALPCHSNDFDSDNWKTPKAPPLPQFDVKRPDQKSVKSAPPPKADTHTTPKPDSNPFASASSSASSSSASSTVTSPSSTSTVDDEESRTGGDKDPGEAKSPETTATETSEAASPSKEGEGGEAAASGEEGPPQFAKAIYDYSTDHSDDLQFHVGDVIRLITPNVEFSTHDPNNPVWLLGELRDNPEKTGSFPSNYVEEFKP